MPSPYREPLTRAQWIDRVVAGLLYLVLVGGSAVLGFLGLVGAALGTDSCGVPSGDDALMCNTVYWGAVFFGFVGTLFLLDVGVLAALWLAHVRRRAVTPWAVLGILAAVLATLLFLLLASR